MDLLPGFGNIFFTAAAFIIALSVIVTVHEYGHYIVGRWSGIKAEVFSVGFGPRLISRVDRHGTRWQIAALPLGGYVRFLGDADAASAGTDGEAMAQLTPEERRHTMHGAPLWARAVTVVAGPVFNFILSILVIAGLMLWSGRATEEPLVDSVVALPGGPGELRQGDRILAIAGIAAGDYTALNAAIEEIPPGEWLDWTVARDGAEITVQGPQLYPARFAGVQPTSAAFDAGLREGDVITAIDGLPAWRFSDLQTAVKAAEGAPVALSIWRPAGRDAQPERFDVTLSARKTDMPIADGRFETRYLIGATGAFVFAPMTEPTPLGDAITGGARATWGIITQSLAGIRAMVTGEISTCNLTGALRIAEASGAAAQAGLTDFIWFIAVLSTAVGFINLFPIPVLDGGHLMFHLWEGIAGKPPSDRVMNVLMALGLGLVLMLMLFGLSNDIMCP